MLRRSGTPPPRIGLGWAGLLGETRAAPVPVVLLPALALLLIYALSYLRFAVQLAGFPFDFDQGEGYDAWSAWLINLGQWPYTSNAVFPYYSSNYPPLWSYVVSIPMAWLGPGLLAARAVSSIAGLGAAAVIGLAAAQRAGRRLAGVLAAGLFLASPYVFHTTPLARVNSLALLAAVGGLTLLERRGWRMLVLGCLALLAALYTKPTMLDAAAAGLLALALRGPRPGLAGAALLLGLGLAGLAGLLLATHGAFWLNVVAGNANPFDVQQLINYMLNFGALHCVVLALALAECVGALLHRDWSPWVLYFPLALLAAVSVGKWGAGESYFLGAIAASCVLAGSWSAGLLEAAQPAAGRWALGAALCLQALLLAHAGLSAAVPWLPDRGPQQAALSSLPSADDLAAGRSLADEVRRRQGPALSEDPSFVVAAGLPLIGNATQLRNLYEAGLWDPTPMVNDLRAHRYAIVVLHAELYPEPVLAAIGRYYFEERTVRMHGATYHVFLPGAQ